MEVSVGVDIFGRGNVFYYFVEQRGAVFVWVVEVVYKVAVFRRAENNGGVELFGRCAELYEKLQNFVERGFGVAVGAVNFVDYDDWFQPLLKSLAQNESSLRLRAVEGVDHKQNAVNHFHYAFNLSAEVGVPGGIDNVDCVAAPVNRGVFRLDCNSLFALQIH